MAEHVEKANPFQLNQYLVEPDRDRISLGEQQFKLEPKVMAVLVYLAQHPERVISVDELMAQVWKGTIVSRQSVQRCVSVLRKIFSTSGDDDVYICTFPKKGYQLAITPVILERTENSYIGPNTAVKRPYYKIYAGLFVLTIVAVLMITNVFVPNETNQNSHSISVQSVSKFTAADGYDFEFAIHPTSNAIAFARLVDGQFSIFIRHTDGHEWRVKHIGHAHPAISLAWSPNGQQLIAAWRKSLSSITAFNFNPDQTQTTSEQIIIDTSRYLYRDIGYLNNSTLLVRRSPNSKHEFTLHTINLEDFNTFEYSEPGRVKSLSVLNGSVAYILIDNRQHHLVLKDATGATQLKHTTSTSISDVTWLPDRSGVLYVSDRRVQVFKLDGSVEPLPLEIQGHLSKPRITSDGAQLYVMRYEPNFDIMTHSLLEECCQEITVSGVQKHSGATYSHHNNGFAYVSEASGSPQIWHIRNGQPPEQLTHIENHQSIRNIHWSADDQRIMFSVDNDIYIHDVSDGSDRIVVQHNLFVTPLGFGASADDIYYVDMNNQRASYWHQSISSGQRELLAIPDRSQVMTQQSHLYFLNGNTLSALRGDQAVALASDFASDTRLIAANNSGIYYFLVRPNQRKNIYKFDFNTHSHSTVALRNSYKGLITDVNDDELALTRHEAVVKREIYQFNLK
ncbi:winged helix-turn-helix domain-containing protein [Echinimonas agarilytica]|uniref:Winged helix-turn-helix domain-containing protein n=1 Tax=Echinimonas agarilytica TaxID=1215918 RepID=A0AA42B5U0_9GAMM|nr:winged helix-turn-helix domain-containing protein [Echinimonas agarilytica]MCM2678158.1 winged helix-turn-helix domain-containing protein [Echinimonas agarilytica]